MSEEGTILLCTLLLITIISLLAVSSLSIVLKQRSLVHSYQHKLENKYLCNAALVEAKIRIKERLADKNNWRANDLAGIDIKGSLKIDGLLASKPINIGYELVEVSSESGRADLNILTQNQLNLLPGIGRTLSAKIYQRRVKKKFTAPVELKMIPGVNKKRYQKLVPLITLNNCGKINLNTASAKILVLLNNIGPLKAARIINYRRMNGPFSKREGLKNVSGIGEITYQQLKEKVTTESVLFRAIVQVDIPGRKVKRELSTELKMD